MAQLGTAYLVDPVQGVYPVSIWKMVLNLFPWGTAVLISDGAASGPVTPRYYWS